MGLLFWAHNDYILSTPKFSWNPETSALVLHLWLAYLSGSAYNSTRLFKQSLYTSSAYTNSFTHRSLSSLTVIKKMCFNEMWEHFSERVGQVSFCADSV